MSGLEYLAIVALALTKKGVGALNHVVGVIMYRRCVVCFYLTVSKTQFPVIRDRVQKHTSLVYYNLCLLEPESQLPGASIKVRVRKLAHATLLYCEDLLQSPHVNQVNRVVFPGLLGLHEGKFYSQSKIPQQDTVLLPFKGIFSRTRVGSIAVDCPPHA